MADTTLGGKKHPLICTCVDDTCIKSWTLSPLCASSHVFFFRFYAFRFSYSLVWCEASTSPDLTIQDSTNVSRATFWRQKKRRVIYNFRADIKIRYQHLCSTSTTLLYVAHQLSAQQVNSAVFRVPLHCEPRGLSRSSFRVDCRFLPAGLGVSEPFTLPPNFHGISRGFFAQCKWCFTPRLVTVTRTFTFTFSWYGTLAQVPR